MIYAVIPFESDEALFPELDALKKKNQISIYDDEAPRVYFVSFHGTTRELAEAIGYGKDGQKGTGIVLPISNYFGFASKDLWEWLNLYQNGN